MRHRLTKPEAAPTAEAKHRKLEKDRPAAAAPAVAATEPAAGDDKDKLSPAVRKLVDENNLDASARSQGTGKDGRLTKGDVLLFLKDGGASAPSAATAAAHCAG